ncbi:hypothetical protein ABK040_013235 [Willaertia magna]
MSSQLNVNSTITLNDGTKMPLIGLGTWRSEPQLVIEAIKTAIRSGYRHLDCAELYGNEKEIGQALQEIFKEGTVKREDLWITSKLWNTHKRAQHVRPALEKTLKDLQINYLDQYLIHWPISFQFQTIELDDYKNIVPKDENSGMVKLDFVPLRETWKEMEKLVEDGLVKSIGVSNFSVTDVMNLLAEDIKIKPSVNQIEINPYFPNTRLIETLKKKEFGGIISVAYCPLGHGGETSPLHDNIVKEIAQKYNKSPAQIIIRWGLQRGYVILPKSTTESRIKENINVYDFNLSDEDVKQITDLGKVRRRAVDPIGAWGGVTVFED